VQIRDDVHETVRLLVSKEKLLGKTTKSLGLIPIAGKPLHIGHWKLIEKAAEENTTVVIYTTTSDRAKRGEFPIKGDDFVHFWTDIFLPVLPKNVRVKFVDSPVRAIMHELEWLEQSLVQDKQNVPNINLYSDKVDVETNFKDEDLKKYPELLIAGKIKKVELIAYPR
jgi:nicotinamide mononucleotide adenylyltransferase